MLSSSDSDKKINTGLRSVLLISLRSCRNAHESESSSEALCRKSFLFFCAPLLVFRATGLTAAARLSSHQLKSQPVLSSCQHQHRLKNAEVCVQVIDDSQQHFTAFISLSAVITVYEKSPSFSPRPKMNQVVFLKRRLVPADRKLVTREKTNGFQTAMLALGSIILSVFAALCFFFVFLLSPEGVLLLSPAGEVPPVLAGGALGQVPVLRGGSYGGVQHAPVHSQRVQSHRCQGALGLRHTPPPHPPTTTTTTMCLCLFVSVRIDWHFRQTQPAKPNPSKF